MVKAVELIDHSNQRTEDGVNERCVQLDSLIATLDIRTEDIEKRLTRFSGLLDESLDAASTRAREVARLVSEASAEGTRAISEQYERVRENAEGERQRSADTMRAIYEQTAGETQALFQSANERFAESVQGMKRMAAEMRASWKARATNSGAASLNCRELPAPPRCRVIVGQIEASPRLITLWRHGRNLDAVEPVLHRTREEPTLAVVGGRSEPPRAPADIPRSEMPPPQPPRPPQRSESSGFAPPARRAPAEPPAVTAAPADPGRGWLSDLLNRASREEPMRDVPREPARETTRDVVREQPRASEDRPPRHSIESLDSLSVDIARMIDHYAAADLWDRYKPATQRVHPPALYAQGQQAFDDIHKKYRRIQSLKRVVAYFG